MSKLKTLTIIIYDCKITKEYIEKIQETGIKVIIKLKNKYIHLYVKW